MARVNKSIQKIRARGRPKKPGGPGLVVPVRLSKAQVAKLDRLAAAAKATRSEAIRQMIDRA